MLVGPSGCGKSTTLRMLAGLEETTEGQIMIGDRVVNDLPPRDRDIAMVFQSYALYPHKSVYENLAFGLRNRRFPKADIHQRVQSVAELLEITDLLKRPPRHLSGGQRQRVALGRAIVREPAVFLMDEPLSNLDAQLRVTMRAELIKLHDQLATTIVYVTHDQVEALTMGTRIAVLRDGILEQIGTADDLYGTPKNRFVAGFIGSPAMNFIPGRIAVRDGGAALRGRCVVFAAAVCPPGSPCLRCSRSPARHPAGALRTPSRRRRYLADGPGRGDRFRRADGRRGVDRARPPRQSGCGAHRHAAEVQSRRACGARHRFRTGAPVRSRHRERHPLTDRRCR